MACRKWKISSDLPEFPVINDRFAQQGYVHHLSLRGSRPPSCHCEPVRTLARQSVSPLHWWIRRKCSKNAVFGERIATPACALVRNDSGSRYPGGTIVRSCTAPAVEGPKGCASSTQCAKRICRGPCPLNDHLHQKRCHEGIIHFQFEKERGI